MKKLIATFLVALHLFSIGLASAQSVTWINAGQFGMSTSASAATNTAALVKAASAATATGAGKVIIPCGTFPLTQYTYPASINLTIEGCAPAYGYDVFTGGTVLSCTTGTWCVRMPSAGNTAIMTLKNVTLSSNGQLNSVAPNPIITAGVEYGLLIEGGGTVVENVTSQGFQYGAGISAFGNANIFRNSAFVWNTKAGFFVTYGSADAYAAYHPNLTPPATLGATTTFSMDNVNIRRNGWGMILRDGQGVLRNIIVESNFFGGMLEWVGTLDLGGVSYMGERVHLENNWPSFSTASAYTISQNNLLQESLGVWIPWTISGTNTATDAGYQLLIGGSATGTGAGPAGQRFRDFQFVIAGNQKAGYLKSAYQTRFEGGSDTSGAGAANWRLNAGTGSQYATATGFENFALSTAPTSYGNRGYYWVLDTSYYGGMNWIQGGSKIVDSAYTGTITAGDMTVNGITGTISYVTDGNSVTLNLPATFTGTSNATTFSITGAPAAIRPTVTKKFNCNSQDNSGSFASAICTMDTGGTLTVFKNVNANAFTSSGTKSLLDGSVTYGPLQ